MSKKKVAFLAIGVLACGAASAADQRPDAATREQACKAQASQAVALMQFAADSVEAVDKTASQQKVVGKQVVRLARTGEAAVKAGRGSLNSAAQMLRLVDTLTAVCFKAQDVNT